MEKRSIQLSKPWSDIPEAERVNLLDRYTEIRTYDGGAIKFIDDRMWIMSEFGYANDQGMAWHATSKPLEPLDAATIAHANDVLRRWQGAYETSDSVCSPEPSKAH